MKVKVAVPNKPRVSVDVKQHFNQIGMKFDLLSFQLVQTKLCRRMQAWA